MRYIWRCFYLSEQFSTCAFLHQQNKKNNVKQSCARSFCADHMVFGSGIMIWQDFWIIIGIWYFVINQHSFINIFFHIFIISCIFHLINNFFWYYPKKFLYYTEINFLFDFNWTIKENMAVLNNSISNIKNCKNSPVKKAERASKKSFQPFVISLIRQIYTPYQLNLPTEC